MKAAPADYFGQQAVVRADGRVLYDIALFQVKAPGESRGPWDYYREVARLAPADAFRPLADSECPLARP